MFSKILTSNDFILQDDGHYVATILGTTHKLKGRLIVEKMNVASTGGYNENVIFSFSYDGLTHDVNICVDVPGTYRVVLNKV